MQEHADDLTNQTTSTTGRGYNRQTTDRDHADTGVATDLYAPVPGDDDNTRPGMVGERTTPTTTTTTRVEPRTTSSRTTDTVTDRTQDWDSTRTPMTDRYTMQRRTESDSGMMDKIKSNPLAVVAAATAGGMLLGRMMRNRGQHNNEGYLRSAPSGYGYQGYQPSYSYQQPSFRPYQPASGYQGYQGYQGQGFQQGGYQGYQPAPGMHGAPQYRAEQEFHPDEQFEGRHENFRSGSHWD